MREAAPHHQDGRVWPLITHRSSPVRGVWDGARAVAHGAGRTGVRARPLRRFSAPLPLYSLYTSRSGGAGKLCGQTPAKPQLENPRDMSLNAHLFILFILSVHVPLWRCWQAMRPNPSQTPAGNPRDMSLNAHLPMHYPEVIAANGLVLGYSTFESERLNKTVKVTSNPSRSNACLRTLPPCTRGRKRDRVECDGCNQQAAAHYIAARDGHHRAGRARVRGHRLGAPPIPEVR